MKKVNKFVASLLAGSMVLSMAACGNPEGNGGSSDTPGSSVDNSTVESAGGNEVAPRGC